MATRCNVLIKYGNEEILLYKHYDGYPSYTGKIIKEYLKKNLNKIKCISDVTNGIKNLDLFEDTSSIHGDIEYLYYVIITKNVIGLICYSIKHVDNNNIKMEYNIDNNNTYLFIRNQS